jgi:C-terminal processing protease CtpA/Prc
MKTFIILTALLSTGNLLAQKAIFNPAKTYDPEELRVSSRELFQELSRKHPGFYRYVSKASLDSSIDSTITTINRPLTGIDYYRKLKPLIAKIGCVHTGISLSEDYQRHLDTTSTLLPLALFTDAKRRVFISHLYDTTQTVPIGAEVLSINGQDIKAILQRLMDAIPADGYNQSEKLLVLNHRFPFWYQTIIDTAVAFALVVRTNGEEKLLHLRGVRSKVLPTLESVESNYAKPLEFRIKDSVGILSVHSFAKSSMKKHDQDFQRFMKKTFKTIKDENIKKLILDLRYNTGGTDGNAVELASYFFDKPFRYWDRIEVTEPIAKEIKGVYRLFYKRPVKRDSVYLWRKTWVTHEFDYYEPQRPAKYSYSGRTFVLTNGLCLSSCADLVAVLSHNKKAIVVGEETGGGYQGNTSGMMPKTKIAAGLQVTVPLQKYVTAVDPQKNRGRGTTPDIRIVPDFQEWIEKRDVEMEAALAAVKQKR